MTFFLVLFCFYSSYCHCLLECAVLIMNWTIETNYWSESCLRVRVILISYYHYLCDFYRISSPSNSIGIYILCINICSAHRTWKPGADDNFADNLRYLRGFMQLQDMVEGAIVKLQSDSNASFTSGVSMQQMPYPCHKEDLWVLKIKSSTAKMNNFAFLYKMFAHFLLPIVING